jgi:hypothetical protein
MMNAVFSHGLSVSYQGKSHFLPAEVIIDFAKQNNEYLKKFDASDSLNWLQENGHMTVTNSAN